MIQEQIQSRVYGCENLPTLIYLPGLHGDWTLISSFRAAIAGRVRFVEFTYPRRPQWALDEYAKAVVDELAANGITSGWLLGESFSSQVAWKIVERNEVEARFVTKGVILSGGFVRHPVIPGVHCFHAVHRMMPGWMFRVLILIYSRYARLRHRRAPETLANIAEFVQRRTPEDRNAIGSRYPLIAGSDFRDLVRRMHIPVYALSGFFDPIVPWWFVIPWLRRNCPGFCASRVIFNADHNVLATTPKKSAEQVLRWMKDC